MWTKDSFVLRITRRKGKRKSLIADSTFISTSTAAAKGQSVQVYRPLTYEKSRQTNSFTSDNVVVIYFSRVIPEGISEDVEAGLLVVLRDAASVFNMM